MKKAILVVSFGTSYLDTLEKTIKKAEKQIRDNFIEYDIYRAFTSHKIIKKLKEKKVGRPIFYYQGIEELPQDYSLFIEATKELYEENNAVVLMGHGTAHPANSVYGCLQAVFEDEGYENVFVTTVEGYPNFENVISRVKRKNIREVTLAPLMVVAGDHAHNDMAGEDEDSWLSMFNASGKFENVETQVAGLGRIEAIQKIYVEHTKEAMK